MVSLQYQLTWIITYNDHGTITKKEILEKYHDEWNLTKPDMTVCRYPKLQFVVPNSLQGVKVQVQMRTFDTVNKMYSLPTQLEQFHQNYILKW